MQDQSQPTIKKSRWVFTFRTYFIIGVFVLLALSGAFLLSKRIGNTNNISKDLSSYGSVGKQVLEDISILPAHAVTSTKDAYQMIDDTYDGITITTAGQESKPDDQRKVQINFSKDYSKPLEVKLDDNRSIFIADQDGSGFSSELLKNIPANLNNDPQQDPKTDLIGPADQYIKYQSKDKRKTLYYGYLKDGATQEKKLKNWLVYQKGSGTEQESYSFKNAKLALDQHGQVEVRYDDGQSQGQNSNADLSQLDSNLVERAQKVIQKETGEDITKQNQNQAPADFIIPEPFFIDKDGNRTMLKWEVGEDGSTLKLAIQADKNSYPLALDPTLSFTAPANSNTGDVIGGESSSFFGGSMATGDFNSDGYTDLAVGAYTYSSDTGRAYVFYNDSAISASAVTADVMITGESAASSQFGFSLETGDFNVDGKTDLAVGAHAYSSAAGRAYIFCQSPSGGIDIISAASASAIITGEASSRFGISLASGDFNADGKTDLAVGAYAYSSGVGRAYIFYNDGLIPSSAATSANVIITGEASSYFGWAMVSGDLNSDGKTDLVVGAYVYTANTGRAYIFNQNSAGGFTTPLAATSANVIITGETSSAFAVTLAAGDFNADGRTDLVAGATTYSTSVGRAYIFYNDGSIPTTAATANVIITGEASGYLGYPFAAGDFNADGRTDLAVGAYRYSTNTGRAYIFYNDGSIPTTAATADVIITGEASSSLGYSLVAGDFNADGKTDLAAGASSYNSNQGRAYIFYSQNGLVGTNNNITGEATTNLFGFSLAAGDFNGDGKTDLAVGAYGYSSNAGRAYIFYNDGSIPTTAATADVIITGEASSYFSQAMTVGDFNSDGKTDLAVGAYMYTTTTGRAYIFYQNSAGGFTSSIATAANVIITGETTSTYLGHSLAAGDFNADGKTDLAVGADLYNSAVGRAYVFYQNSAGGFTTPLGAGSASVIISGESANNSFGGFLASGDFNTDGKTDLVVGAYGFTTNTGRAYIFYQNSVGGFTTPLAATAANAIITGETTNNYFGYSFAAGDFNADGKTDLAVGAYGHTSGGRAYIFYQNSAGGFTTPLAATAANVIITGEASSQFGRAMDRGDFNADGKTDLAVGASLYSGGTGRAYIFYNDGTFPTTAANADVIITGDATTYSLARPLISGDFNADGKTDLAVAAYSYTSNTGRVFIYSGQNRYAWRVQPQLNQVKANTFTGQELKIDGNDGATQFGLTLATGDFNADGKTDLAVAGRAFTTTTGRVYIFYNDGSYPAASLSADVIITGEVTYSYFGQFVQTGDFNSDGKADLAVGAYYYNPGSALHTGRVYIFYQNSSGGFTTPLAATSANDIITGEGAESYFGETVAAGDFNADGKTDLAIGVYTFTVSSLANVGRVYVFYQDSAGGFTATSAGSANVIIDGTDTTNGTQYAERFGIKMMAGDLNADGKTDLVVSGQYYYSNRGRVYVFYNDGSYATTAGAADVMITNNVTPTNQYLGSSLALGDFNSDGKTDLAVGGNLGTTYTGRAYIFYQNSAGGFTTPLGTSSANVAIQGEGTNNQMGISMVAGDFNSDGKTDLAVGASRWTNYTGRIYVFYQDTAGGFTVTAAASANAILDGETSSYLASGFMSAADLNNDGKTELLAGEYYYNASRGRVKIYTFNDTATVGQNNGDLFGFSLAPGDFNFDGKKDLAVGAYGWTSNQGRVYIFYNKNNSLSATSAATADSILTGEAASVLGFSLAPGDFNFDGKTDLAVGAWNYSTAAGRVYIFNQNAAGGFNATIAATAANVIITGQAGATFGVSMAAGDLNSDGKVDLTVGSSAYNPGSAADTGRVYIFNQNSAGGFTTPLAATSANVILTGESASNYFGREVSVGDFNSDGKTDLVVGANTYSSNNGRVYVFNQNSAGGFTSPKTAASADSIITGEASSGFGWMIVAGDFNTDNVTDLAVGALYYNTNTGRVYIFYNNNGVFASDATSADATITGEATNDYFGSSLASGDFNQDNRTDLMVGAYGYSSNTGRVYFIRNDGLYPQQASQADMFIKGISGSKLGYSLAVDDFNGDRIPDLAVGGQGSASDPGHAYVYITEAKENVENNAVYNANGSLKFNGSFTFH